MALLVTHTKVSTIADDPTADIKASDFGSLNTVGPTHVLAGVLPAENMDLSGVALLAGSYADPAWITSLAGAKIAGTVPTATLAAAALVLATPRTINGVLFDGSGNIAIPGPDLSAYVVTSDARLSDARVPLTHTHAEADVLGLVTDLGVLASAIAGKAALVHTHAFADLTSRPTSLAGYGILDPVLLPSGSYADPAWLTSLAASKITGTVASATLAAAATVLATPRTLNGVSFNGSANITVPADAGTLTGTTLAAGVTGAPQTWAGLQTFNGGVVFAGTWKTTLNGLAATPTDGLVLENTTPATTGVLVQISPQLRLRGAALNSVSVLSELAGWAIDVLPIAAAGPITSILRFSRVLAGGALGQVVSFDSSGAITGAGAFTTSTNLTVGAAGELRYLGSTILGAPSNGKFAITNGARTFGVTVQCLAQPVVTGNGTIVAKSVDTCGKVTSTITGAGTITITFSGAWPNAPACCAMNETTANPIKASSTTTVLTITGTFVTGDVISYLVLGPK